jgi:Fe-S cluster assembly protein SufD
VFKNVLADKSLAEFSSLVHMWKGAFGSDSDQLDKNLLLSDDAIAYSRPQLKIDADDVKATHGAATGEVAGDELFYLKSRGLDDNTARSVLTFGFAEEIIQEIPFPAVREKLGAWVHAELEKMLGEAK